MIRSLFVITFVVAAVAGDFIDSDETYGVAQPAVSIIALAPVQTYGTPVAPVQQCYPKTVVQTVVQTQVVQVRKPNSEFMYQNYNRPRTHIWGPRSIFYLEVSDYER